MESKVRSGRSGWLEEENERLFTAVRAATEQGAPLRSVFESLADDLGRKPNSIRNYYYACLRRSPDPSYARATPFRMFTPEETHELLRKVLMARGQGQSVRACVMAMAEGDHSRMLRYQNKYRTVLRHRPEMLAEVREELRREGLPYPKDMDMERDDVTFCDPEDSAATRLMSEPCISAMLEGLKVLLRRAAKTEDAEAHRRELDRLQVHQDLRRMAWEKEYDEAISHLGALMGLVREFLALPRESQVPQLDTFRDAALHLLQGAEAFLTSQTTE